MFCQIWRGVCQQSAAALPDPSISAAGTRAAKETLRHRRFPNVFGIGDINGTVKGKTAATVKKSTPLLVRNLIDVIAGREPSQRFDGYTSCPLLVCEGAALLIEFDYKNQVKLQFAKHGLSADAEIVTRCRSGSERGEPSSAFLCEISIPNARDVDGFQCGTIKDGPQAGFRLHNGWRNSGLPWLAKLNAEKIHRVDRP